MSSGDSRREYVRWLQSQLSPDPDARYWGLANLMFDQEFHINIDMDHNRLIDGVDLRVEWLNSTGKEPCNMHECCSFLELLIGLSRRMAFVAGGSALEWAARLLENLGINDATDPLDRRKQNHVQEVMQTVINRTYMPDGSGGFFPLAWPDRDQREVELWYQLNAFIEERLSEYHP